MKYDHNSSDNINRDHIKQLMLYFKKGIYCTIVSLKEEQNSMVWKNLGDRWNDPGNAKTSKNWNSILNSNVFPMIFSLINNK